MADGVRLVGMVVGSFLALYAGNIGFQVNKSLLPNFFTAYYYTSYFPGINKLHKHDYKQDIKIGVLTKELNNVKEELKTVKNGITNVETYIKSLNI